MSFIEQGLIGAGDVSLKNLDVAGAGYIPVGNAQTFSIQPQVERKQRKSKKRDTHGQVIGSRAIIGDIPLKISFDTFSRQGAAMVLLGNDADFAQASAEDQSETLTLPHDQWVDLPHVAISNVDVAVGSAAAVEDTDYVVDEKAGMIMALSSGSLADNAEATIGYDAAAVTGGFSIKGAVKAEVNVAVKFSGKNLDNGDNMVVDVYQVKLSPTSAMELLSDDYTVNELEGLVQTPSDKDHPFKVTSWPEAE